MSRREGTPQGGPLSPLLANVLLDELDQELTRRDLRFVRYADDVMILVKSRSAGHRVMSSVQRWLARHLRLVVNEKKSRVEAVRQCPYLGFVVNRGRLKIAASAKIKLKKRIRELTNRSRGVSFSTYVAEVNAYTSGWLGYFGVSEVWRDCGCGTSGFVAVFGWRLAAAPEGRRSRRAVCEGTGEAEPVIAWSC